MATNQYLPIATAPGANALSFSSYLLLQATLIDLGFQPGLAKSEEMNAILRQLSTAVSAVARLGSDFGSTNMLDDGNVVNFRDGLYRAIGAISRVSGTPPGTVVAFAGGSVPAGWLECNGQAVGRTAAPELFTAIGVIYGTGDGSTTFNLPDLRGEFLRGWDHTRGVDAGRALGSGQADETRAHTHTLPLESGGSSNQQSLTDTGNTDEGPYGSPTTGSTGGAETRPRNVAVMYIIKI